MSAETTTNGNGTALAVREPTTAITPISDREIDSLFRVSKALAMSGLFKDTRQAEQAFAKVLIGRDLGLSPTQALMGIHIIEGKPELSANLQAAFVKQSPRHDYQVVTLTDEACEIAFYRDGDELGRSSFTMADARTAGLAGRGPWKSYPRNMLFARAMSNGVAFFCPEITGGVRTYADGEISGDEQPPTLDDSDFGPQGGTTQAGVSSPHAAAHGEAGTAGESTGSPATAPEPEPEDADVVADQVDVDELEALCKLAIDQETWDGKTLRMQLVAAGATDTSTVRAALQSLTFDGSVALRDALNGALGTGDGQETLGVEQAA